MHILSDFNWVARTTVNFPPKKPVESNPIHPLKFFFKFNFPPKIRLTQIIPDFNNSQTE